MTQRHGSDGRRDGIAEKLIRVLLLVIGAVMVLGYLHSGSAPIMRFGLTLADLPPLTRAAMLAMGAVVFALLGWTLPLPALGLGFGISLAWLWLAILSWPMSAPYLALGWFAAAVTDVLWYWRGGYGWPDFDWSNIYYRFVLGVIFAAQALGPNSRVTAVGTMVAFYSAIGAILWSGFVFLVRERRSRR